MATVPPEFSQFVEQQVAAGRYQSADQVIAAGLHLLQEREKQLQALREELRPALEELDAGGGIVVPRDKLGDYFSQLMQRVNADES